LEISFGCRLNNILPTAAAPGCSTEGNGLQTRNKRKKISVKLNNLHWIWSIKVD
jgi:hypothetical protein